MSAGEAHFTTPSDNDPTHRRENLAPMFLKLQLIIWSNRIHMYSFVHLLI